MRRCWLIIIRIVLLIIFLVRKEFTSHEDVTMTILVVDWLRKAMEAHDWLIRFGLAFSYAAATAESRTELERKLE